MLSVGIFEAKAQLSQLVERVAQGEEVLVAPEASSDASALADWTAELRAFRRGIDRGAKPGSKLSELIAAGRR